MSSTSQITPRTNHARGVVSTAEPTTPDITAQLAAPHLSGAEWQAFQRATTPDYFGWLDHVRSAAGCTRPIRLVGDLYTVRRTSDTTAVVLDHQHTRDLPDGAIYKACGNRRATVCPSCARTYQHDAYQILRAFLAGGKGVPDTVTGHPAIFATLTAPSFGLVHTRVVRTHSCVHRRRCDCRPDPCHARTGPTTPGLCQHHQPAVCFARHDPDDPRLGQPLCLDCYDHDGQVVWNHLAPALWHRTKQTAERRLVQLAKRRGIPSVRITTDTGSVRYLPPVRLAHGKAAEMQRRAVIHFHALLRLDGTDPDDPTAVVPPPAGLTTRDLADALRYAAEHTLLASPAHPDQHNGWSIHWGDQLDIKHIKLAGDTPITDLTVQQYITEPAAAGYLAKYATKSVEITGHRSGRLTADTVDQYADPDGDHIARLINACWRLGQPTHTPTPLSSRPPRARPATALGPRWTCATCGTRTRLRHCPQCTPPAQPEIDTKPANSHEANPWAGLRRWAHTLGYGGHFLTKSRRGCPTFTLLRSTRLDYRRTQLANQDQGVIRTADHTAEETTLIVGVLTFAGAGWHTTGDALLANTSAAMARARHQAAREQLAHEQGTNPNNARILRVA